MDKLSMIPLYQQLSDTIKQQILDGTLKAGDKMLTESEFSQKYSVSRITVRKAIEILADEGYVVRKQGIGTFVAQKKLRRTMENQIMSFTEMGRQGGQIPSAELISVEWITANTSVQRHLHVEDNSRVLKMVRLRKIDDEPVMIEESYYPETLSFLMQENLTGSTYQIFRDHNLIPSHSIKTVEICYAEPEEAKLLNVEENQALMLQKDEVSDQNGDMLHYSKLLINSLRYQLTIVV